MTMSCPFCTHQSDDFEDSDEHFTEHVTEYQMSQQEEFGEYSQ